MNQLLSKSKIVKSNKFLGNWSILTIDTLASLMASVIVWILAMALVPNIKSHPHIILVWLIGSLISSGLAFSALSIYKAVIRYSTIRDIGRICLACITKEFILWILMASISMLPFTEPLLMGMIIMDLFISICMLSLLRVLIMVIYDKIRKNRICDKFYILVYGTGDKAISAVSRLRYSPHYQIKAFIVPGRQGTSHKIDGLQVCYYENKEDVLALITKYGITGILFPSTADARKEIDRLIAFCRSLNVRTLITPSIDEVGEDGILSNYVRKIKIEELLGRDEIKISMDEIIENFKGKVVMVTGAAGSIGSELCRQLATFGVRQLILFDNAETPLHNIRLELEDKYPDLNFVPIVGDVRSLDRLDMVFRKYHPQIIFHAAAYKHVPLMEENPCEAVHVNVVGSRQVADKCVEYDVEKMVMVSTDKAVNPTNIMGCTKRLAEIYVQSLGLAIERGEKNGKTTFVTTRFGNVLGSNGSVIPRFKEQIEQGGPVTVTHPEITRFFMTIPEACRLVMEAATFATGTEIFVFDMGESVKIRTLAERMINLAGLEVDKDIKIEYTGLRPGEKLYEEVLATKENTKPTTHKRIFIANAREYAFNEAIKGMDKLQKYAIKVEIPEMVKLMKAIVPEFKSKNSEFEKYDNFNNDSTDN